MNSEYPMTMNIKALYDAELKTMDDAAQKKAI